MHRLENGRLEGKQVRRLMLANKVTIRRLKEITGITLKRIREVRTKGFDDRNVIRDWIQAISGEDLGPL